MDKEKFILNTQQYMKHILKLRGLPEDEVEQLSEAVRQTIEDHISLQDEQPKAIS